MKIGVLGGGSAGYLSALYLNKKFSHHEVTLVESSNIPIIGVGEATTPIILKLLHHDLDFSVNEFYKEVRPTLKTGVRFHWGKKNGRFDNAFGPLFTVASLYQDGHTHNANLNSVLLQKEKVPFVKTANNITPIKVKNIFAYHLDNQSLVRYLKKKFTERGINHWDTEVSSFVQNEKSCDVTHIIDESGEKREFDLLIDCSGFSSMIIGKFLKTPFIDFDKTLFTNKAIVGKRPNDGKPKPYTSATTLKYGWLWNTPTRTEDHLGYVFCDKFCSIEEAREEMSQFCEVNETKVISFRTGRHEHSWVKNVVAIGNSFAFIEPLESTGIHMIVKQLYDLSKQLKKNVSMEQRRAVYNKKVNSSWDLLKNYIGLHFKYNNYSDTPFWKHCRENVDLSDIQFYLDFFENTGPVCGYRNSEEFKRLAKDVIFPPFTYDLIMVNSMEIDNLKDKIPERIDTLAEKKLALNKMLADQAIYHNEALEFLENCDMEFVKDWYNETSTGDHIMSLKEE